MSSIEERLKARQQGVTPNSGINSTPGGSSNSSLEERLKKRKASIPVPAQEEKPWWEKTAEDVAGIPSALGNAFINRGQKVIGAIEGTEKFAQETGGTPLSYGVSGLRTAGKIGSQVAGGVGDIIGTVISPFIPTPVKEKIGEFTGEVEQAGKQAIANLPVSERAKQEITEGAGDIVNLTGLLGGAKVAPAIEKTAIGGAKQITKEALEAGQKAKQIVGETGELIKKAPEKIEKIGLPSSPVKVIQNRENTILTAQKAYKPLRDKMNSMKDGGAEVRKRLATADIWEGAIDDAGKINTKQPGGAFDQYKEATIGGSEKVVKEGLQAEGKSITPEALENKLIDTIENSVIKGKEKTTALNNIKQEIAAYKRNPDGSIPLTEIQDAKISTTLGLYDKATPIQVKTYDKVLGKGLKEAIEETSGLNIKKVNEELAKYYDDLDLIGDLDGKIVQGGRLGKYISQGVGTATGATIGGLAGGGFGAGAGALIGGDLASRIKVMMMKRGLAGETKIPLQKSPYIEQFKKEIKELPQSKANLPKKIKP